MDIAIFSGKTMILDRESERGAALIIVLGLVAIVAAWASTAGYEDMLLLRRADHALVSAKAELACLSSLTLAKAALKQDAQENKYDTLDEIWAQDMPPFAIDDGLVSVKIIDANRYLDLNMLLDKDGKVDVLMVAVARRLFSLKGQDALLVDALVDWMDADDVPLGLNGAENSSYFDQSYRAKNAALDRMDELLLVHGFDRQMMKAIQDAVVVWPVSKDAKRKININTVEKDVLLSMFPAMNDTDFEDVVAGRPYESLQKLKSSRWVKSKQDKQMLSYLSVASDRFLVRSHAIFGKADRVEEYALLRQRGKFVPQWREHLIWRP